MRLNTKKIIFIFILSVAAIGAATAYYLYNKGPVDVKSSSGIKINAEDLYNAFSSDSVSAQKKYSNRILNVYGIINTVTVNVENKQIVTLKTSIDGAYINCVIEEPTAEINTGEKVNIKGICSGIGQGEPDLGIKGDVYLSRCLIVN